MSGAPVLELARVTRGYGATRAVDAVDLRVGAAESVALVGRSGSGKTTIARLVVGLEPPDSGVVRLRGVDLVSTRRTARRSLLARVGLIAQDPYASLSPSMRIIDIVAEPLRIAGVGATEARERATRALIAVDLGDPSLHGRTADELSGGECQRVGLARAVVTEPDLVVADEPTSMLDAPRQREFLAILGAIRARRPLALLLVTHDLALAMGTCDRVVTLEAGRVVEDGPTDAVLAMPQAPATRALLGAARARQAVPGPATGVA